MKCKTYLKYISNSCKHKHSFTKPKSDLHDFCTTFEIKLAKNVNDPHRTPYNIHNRKKENIIIWKMNISQDQKKIQVFLLLNLIIVKSYLYLNLMSPGNFINIWCGSTFLMSTWQFDEAVRVQNDDSAFLLFFWRQRGKRMQTV